MRLTRPTSGSEIWAQVCPHVSWCFWLVLMTCLLFFRGKPVSWFPELFAELFEPEGCQLHPQKVSGLGPGEPGGASVSLTMITAPTDPDRIPGHITRPFPYLPLASSLFPSPFLLSQISSLACLLSPCCLPTPCSVTEEPQNTHSAGRLCRGRGPGHLFPGREHRERLPVNNWRGRLAGPAAAA